MELSDIESALSEVTEELLAPRPGECLACYLDRTIPTFGCRDRSLAARWHRARPRRLRGLDRWLDSHGGYCDCEIVFNVFGDGRRWFRGEVLQCDAAFARYHEDDIDDIDHIDHIDDDDA